MLLWLLTWNNVETENNSCVEGYSFDFPVNLSALLLNEVEFVKMIMFIFFSGLLSYERAKIRRYIYRNSFV